MMRTIYCTFALVFALCCLAPSSASAQTWEEFYALGNDSYNGKKYSEAVSNYVKAIQAAPVSGQRAYLNCARAHNQLGQYAEAHQFYAWYLEMVPDDRKAKEELRRVKRKTKADAPVSILTDAQTAALEQLQAALGSIYVDDDGGGAVALYDVLLRTGYAAPNLGSLQRTIADGLIEEAFTVATPELGQAAPTLDAAGWSSVRKRVSRATSFVDAAVDPQRAQGLLALASAWQEYLKGDYADALPLFESALAADPKLVSGHWGRALTVSVTDTSEDLAPTFAAIDSAEKAFESLQRSPDPFVPLLRAKAYQSIGSHDEAARLLLDL